MHKLKGTTRKNKTNFDLDHINNGVLVSKVCGWPWIGKTNNDLLSCYNKCWLTIEKTLNYQQAHQ
jgi:hypothetical protein